MRNSFIALLIVTLGSLASAQTGKHRSIMATAITCSSASIPTSGLQLWYSGDCYNATGPQPSNGASVSTAWHDRSGNANDATTGGVTYRTGQINGWPALDQVGGSAGWTLTSGVSSTSVITIFAVVKNASISASGAGTGKMHALFSASVDNTNNLVFWSCYLGPNEQGMQAHTITFGSEDTTIGSGTASCDTSWHILNGVYSSGTATFKLDRVADATINNTTATVSQPITKMGSNNGSDKFGGLLAEIIYYNRALTGGELTTVENYLHRKYGL